MAKPFSRLRAAMPTRSRRRAAVKTRTLLNEMALTELRQARRLSQVEIAATLKINQAAVSTMERRTDMYLSTLRRFIEAMGGRLEIVARFSEGEVRVKQFETLEEKRPARVK